MGCIAETSTAVETFLLFRGAQAESHMMSLTLRGVDKQ